MFAFEGNERISLLGLVSCITHAKEKKYSNYYIKILWSYGNKIGNNMYYNFSVIAVMISDMRYWVDKRYKVAVDRGSGVIVKAHENHSSNLIMDWEEYKKGLLLRWIDKCAHREYRDYINAFSELRICNLADEDKVELANKEEIDLMVDSDEDLIVYIQNKIDNIVKSSYKNVSKRKTNNMETGRKTYETMSRIRNKLGIWSDPI